MANEIFLKLMTSEFSGDEVKKIEYSSLLGFALDSIKRKEILEGIYTCYVPFYAFKVNEGNYIVVNTLQTIKNKLSVSRIPDAADIKPVFEDDYPSLEARYKAIESTLLSKSTISVEISGVLSKKSVDGIAKLITQHSSSRNASYKKLTPLISREDVKREIISVGKYAISEFEIENRLNHLFDDVENFIQSEITKLKREREQIETKYNQMYETRKKEIDDKTRQISEEESTEKRRIDEEAESERSDQLVSVRESKRWNQLKKDISSLQESYSQLLTSLDRLDSEEQFDMIINKIHAVQDETQSFGVGLNSSLSEIEYRKSEYNDIYQQATVDKRNVTDKLNTVKEDLKRSTDDIKIEKTSKLEEQDYEIQNSENILQRFRNNRSNLLKRIKSNYIMFSTYALSADLLGASESDQLITILVPVAICKYRERDKLIFIVVPPFEISGNMKKPRSLPLHSENSRIGFDCIAKESFEFLKKPLEGLLVANQNTQAEVQGENNEMIASGDLSVLNAGLVLLEQRKKFPKKNADAILAQSRSFLT